MGKKKSQEQEEEYAECKPGVGGYQIALYKNNNMKILEPLCEESYKYVKTKYKKHSPSSSSSSYDSASGPSHHNKPEFKKVEKKKKKVGVALASSSGGAGGGEVTAKPKRVLTPQQLENLKRGREKRAAALAESKRLASMGQK